MKTDMELLELVAKEDNLEIRFIDHADGSIGGPFVSNSGWNPLAYNNDSYALMCSRSVSVVFREDAHVVEATYKQRMAREAYGSHGKERATRRAIVRAVANDAMLVTKVA